MAERWAEAERSAGDGRDYYQVRAQGGMESAAEWRWTENPDDVLDGFDNLDADADTQKTEDEIGNKDDGSPKGGSLNFVGAEEVELKPVKWVWKGRIARGKLCILAGDPGMGKSQTATDITARITTGSKWPDGGRAPKDSVLILSSEDAPADAIIPRLTAVGADLKRAKILRRVNAQKGKVRSFSLQNDLVMLGKTITALGDVVMVTIVPITSYMGEHHRFLPDDRCARGARPSRRMGRTVQCRRSRDFASY